MANWRSYIDPSTTAGQNTLDGIIANGPTYGIGISDDLSVTGLSTFSDIARFSSTVRLDGQLRDGDNDFGTSGQVLSSDGTDTKWINAAQLSAGAASQVAVNDDSNTNAERFITIVDSSSGNNNVKTDASLKYNPSTNTITTVNITGNVTGNVTGNLTGNVTGDASGNSGTATALQTARNIGGVSFDGSASINLPGVNQSGNQDTSGNAATATKLATARNIGGVSFDGSAAINLPGVNQSGNQDTSGNAATATVLETTRAFSITGEVTANSINFNGSGGVTLDATVDDNVIDYDNLKASNRTSATNGQYLRKRSGNTGGMTWEDIPVVTGANLTGNTLSSGIVNSSLTLLGTLGSLTVTNNITTTDGSLEVGDGGHQSRILIKKADNNTADHIQFYNGTTRVGEIGCLDDSWLRINQETNKNIYTPRMFRADGGFQVDGTTVINGSGQVIAAQVQTLNQNTTGTSGGFTAGDASNLNTGTIPAARLPNHSASLLTSGTIPADRLPNHSASLLTSGTIPDARISGNFLTSNASDTMSGLLTLNNNANRVIVLDRNIASPANYYNDLQMEIRATSGTAGIGFHRSGYSHVGIYHDASGSVKFNMNNGTATLNGTTGTVWGSGNDGSGSGLDADLLDGYQRVDVMNYNNLSNKPTQFSDVRSMNESASTGTSTTNSTLYSDKVTLSINTVSNSRVLVLWGFEIKHSNNNNQRTYAQITASHGFVGGNYEVSHNNQTWTPFEGSRLDISSHTGTRTYRIQFRRAANTGSIRNAYLVAIEMSV